MAPERPHDGESDDKSDAEPDAERDAERDDLEEQQSIKDDEVLEREGLESALMEHDESEAGEDIHHAG